MTRLLIIGAGGHGAVVAEAAAAMGRWSDIAFLDDGYPNCIASGLPVVGMVSELSEHLNSDSEAIVAIGDNRARLELLDSLGNARCAVATIVHPAAIVSPSATIGAGSVLLGGVVVNARANIGRGTILNSSCTVDHDCLLAEGVHVSPGTNLAGGVTVGRCAWLGIGSAVREGIQIGQYSVIGAGAAVIADVPGNVTVGGVPAKVLDT